MEQGLNINIPQDLNLLALSLALCVPRMLVIFSVVPFLASKSIPAMIRNSLVVAFSFLAVPNVYYDLANASLKPIEWLMIVLKEGVIGYSIGYLFGILFWAISSVGVFIDLQKGALSAQVFDPNIGEQTSPLGVFFNQLLVTLIFTSGGFMFFLGSVYSSYVMWPVLDYFPSFNEGAIEFFLNQFDFLMELMLLLAGPAVIIMLVSELGLGLAGRYLEQLNVFSLSMPVKSVLALFVLYFYLVFMFRYLNENYQLFVGDIFINLDQIFTKPISNG